MNIDYKHQEIVKGFEIQKQKMDELRATLDGLQADFDELNAKPCSELTDEEIERRFQLRMRMDEVEKELQTHQANNPTQYYLHTSHILFNYYNKDKDYQVNPLEGGFSASKNPLSKSILDFFMDGRSKAGGATSESNAKPSSPTQGKKSSKTKKSQPKSTYEKFVDEMDASKATEKDTEAQNSFLNSQRLTKTQMLDRYMSYVDSSCISHRDKEDDIEVCHRCNQQKYFIHAEGIIVCKNCGEQDYVFIDCDKPSYKEPPKEIAYFAYKRINHFNEHISQFQGKESTEIPKEIYDMIMKEIKKERITDLSSIKPSKIREILKKLELNKYYEHIPHIINHLNGVPPPNISKSQEETLRVMFKEIQIPFIKYCPRDRQNFLSYTYVLHKFCELLELDDLLPCFPLLKSREKLQEQDAIWEKVCADLGWKFYKSI